MYKAVPPPLLFAASPDALLPLLTVPEASAWSALLAAFAQCAEVARTIDDGILRNYRDAELGAVLGLGFAPQTGGPLTYMNNIGIRNVVAKLKKLASVYGKRYKPAKILLFLDKKNEKFFKLI